MDFNHSCNSFNRGCFGCRWFPRCCIGCILCLRGPRGPQGPQGEPGPVDTTSCACVDQMRNVIRQIIEIYPEDNLIVTMESGNTLSGRPGFLLPAPNTNPNAGIFVLVNNQGVETGAISICKIAAIRVTSADYNDTITYVPTPSELPEGCAVDCEAAIRAYLPVDKEISIRAGDQTVANGTVRKSEYGMVVVVGNNDANPTFISSCKIELML